MKRLHTDPICISSAAKTGKKVCSFKSSHSTINIKLVSLGAEWVGTGGGVAPLFKKPWGIRVD